MKEIIITIIFILLVSAAMAPAFANEEWFEVAEASSIGYDITVTREVPATKTPCQDNILEELTLALIRNRGVVITSPPAEKRTSHFLFNPRDDAVPGGGGHDPRSER
jgi:hypothetical protein